MGSLYKNCSRLLLVLKFFASTLQTVLCLECLLSEKIDFYPQVSILKIRNETTSKELTGTKITFEKDEIVRFRLECKSNLPVKWIFDEDFYDRGIKKTGNYLTSRVVRNFTDEKSYEYIAPYDLEIDSPKNQDPLVLICQIIGRPCQRRIVLSSFNAETNKYSVKLLAKQDETIDDVIDFERELNRSQNNSGSCPLKLTLHFNQKYLALIYFWTPSGPIAVFKQEAAQSLENSFRFTPILEERCIDFVDEKAILQCPQCTQLNWKVHELKPIVFYNAVGDNRGILKSFFDIANPRNFYYSWESVDLQNLVFINAPSEAYKGQEVEVNCDASLYLFSYGTQIGWNNEGDSFPTEFVPWDEIDKGSFSTTYGTINTIVKVRPSKEFLDENDIRSLNVSCIAPIWNSTAWVTKSKMIRLMDSTSPVILDKSEPSKIMVMVGQDISFKCKAEGFPPPSLDIIPPQENLNFTKHLTTEGNYSELVVTISKVELTYEGKYNCIAESVVGKDFKVFELKLSPGLSTFVKVILIGGGVLTVIFIVIATALTLKLRKEKEEFMRLTEEAILKFQEGFKNTTGIGFDSKSEYKDYEIPFGNWEMSGTVLGSGAFGVVKKGVVERGQEKTILAIKMVNAPKDVTEFENSLMELTIMSFIGRHVNIVSLIAACTENIHKRSVYIGVEFCANGDLLSCIEKRRPLFQTFIKDGQIIKELTSDPVAYANLFEANFSTVDLYKWSYQIANGMDYLESKKVLHADLAARNVLLTEENIAKISDFGLSRKLLDSSNYTKKTSWMALESLQFQQFSSKSDVWSYGVTLYELFSLGAEAWPGEGWTIEFVNQLENGRRLARPTYATENMYNAIMLECWRNKPEDRLTFAKARDYFEKETVSLNPSEEEPDNYLDLS